MNPIYQPLYEDMLQDIHRCLALPHAEKDNVENCYWIARNYWDKLQELVKGKGFGSESMELCFFKEAKPAFTSYIEYFSLLAEGLQFEPKLIGLPAEMKGRMREEEWVKALKSNQGQYWKEETGRMDRFYKKHQSFLDYCESSCTQRDEQFFLQRTCCRGDLTQRRPHNRDTELYTVHEEILTTWTAFKKYQEFINQKINEPAQS